MPLIQKSVGKVKEDLINKEIKKFKLQRINKDQDDDTTDKIKQMLFEIN